MKKIFALGIGVMLLLILSACNNTDHQSEEKKNTFIGTITKIEDQTAIVSIEEGEILSSGDTVKVDLSVNKEEVFFINDKIEVEYDGIMRESIPLGINTVSVKKAE